MTRKLAGQPTVMIPLAPYFSPDLGAWIPAVIGWEPETGKYRRQDGPRGFAEYRQAVDASRFLLLTGLRPL